MTPLLKTAWPRLASIITLLISTIGCDQATKVLARNNLNHGTISFLGDMIRLQHAENTGAFLSLGSQLPPTVRFFIFTVFVAGFLAVAGFFLLKNKNSSPLSTFALCMILAGGIGNLIDRALRGSVTDFINVGIGPLRTGIFNVADMAIVAGVLILFLLPKATSKPVTVTPPSSNTPNEV